MNIELICFSCNKSLEFLDRVGFRESCDCSADVHVCKNCQHYDLKAYNECREAVADRQRDKERANYCEHFVARAAIRATSSAQTSRDQLRAQAEALFASVTPNKKENH